MPLSVWLCVGAYGCAECRRRHTSNDSFYFIFFSFAALTCWFALRHGFGWCICVRPESREDFHLVTGNLLPLSIPNSNIKEKERKTICLSDVSRVCHLGVGHIHTHTYAQSLTCRTFMHVSLSTGKSFFFFSSFFRPSISLPSGSGSVSSVRPLSGTKIMLTWT